MKLERKLSSFVFPEGRTLVFLVSRRKASEQKKKVHY